MIKGLLVVVPLITITFFTPYGCGVSHEQYDATQDELVKTQQDLESVQAELDTFQARNSELTVNLDETKTELETTQTELEVTQTELGVSRTELETIETELETIRNELEIAIDKNGELTESLNKVQDEYNSYKSEALRLFMLLESALELNNEIIGLNAGIILNDNNAVYQQCRAVTDTLLELRDIERDEFHSIWDEAFIDTPSSWTLYDVPFVQLLSLHAERILDKVGWLSLHLNK